MKTSARSSRLRRLFTVAVLTLCAGSWATRSSAVQSPQDPPPNPNVEKLLTTRECKGCDFTKTTIVNKDLSGVDLTDANFEAGSLYACDLTGANLSGVNFGDAVLQRSELKNARLAGANLAGANLSFVKNANLDGAGTTSTTTCPDLSKGPCR